MAEAAGAILAEEITRLLRGVIVVSSQLLRLLTGQTATLFQSETKTAANVMFGIVETVQGRIA